jgi:quinone-reactive Ni/Fe-hydrogenase small subunit
MRIVIIGGGISAAYLANHIKKISFRHDVLIISDETYLPYDRIHLCSLINSSKTLEDLKLPLDPTVQVELKQKIIKIDPENKRIFSENSMFSYDKLVIATGSEAKALFDVEKIENASVFRSAKEAFKIADNIDHREVVIIGSGPISLELLETFNAMTEIEKITLLVRSSSLYDRTLSAISLKLMENAFLASGKVRISYEDEIIEKHIDKNRITELHTKKLYIKDPFIVFGIGIQPNIAFARESLECDRGILTDNFMQTSDEHIFAVGECAQIHETGFIAGHVKECTLQAQSALSKILHLEEKAFEQEVSVDMLKVGTFDLIDVISPHHCDESEKLILTSEKEKRIDEYYIHDNRLERFIGINSNMDIGYLQTIMKKDEEINTNTFYENRLPNERGRLICSCEHTYYQDLVETVTENSIHDFSELKAFSHAGRVCGRCKQMVIDVIEESQHLIDPNKPRKTLEERQREKALKEIEKRIEKFNRLHPYNQLSKENFDNALKSMDIATKELNSWISMITASMQLHPSFENSVGDALMSLNRIPIIWLELSDCSGNSEAFIKSSNPSIEDLIFDYISLDYHELIMSASGDQSETALDHIINEQKGKYILIVEGAVPLAMEGKFLRIGRKGETGIGLLERCAEDAALIIGVGSCAYDGGVVAAAPNPTGAVGVGKALQRDDIINIPGCPTNPINIVGTLLYYLMFEELPALDKNNRPLWAYEGRIHDNCERRGHYELGEFVQEWGDEGAKKGYCLFEMGCKGPYAYANCPTMKFNDSTSWPVQAGHGCMACTEKNFFDTYANERELKVEHEKKNCH